MIICVICQLSKIKAPTVHHRTPSPINTTFLTLATDLRWPLSFFRISQPSWIIYLTPGSLFLHSRLPSLATLYVPSPRVFRTLFLFWNSLTLFSHFSSYLRVFQTVFPLLKHSHAFLTQAHSCLRVFQILFLVWNTLTAPWCMLCWHFWSQSTGVFKAVLLSTGFSAELALFAKF